MESSLVTPRYMPLAKLRSRTKMSTSAGCSGFLPCNSRPYLSLLGKCIIFTLGTKLEQITAQMPPGHIAKSATALTED